LNENHLHFPGLYHRDEVLLQYIHEDDDDYHDGHGDYHGVNKVTTEVKLLSAFPNQVTILRGSNIFGLEYGRNSFVGYCMSQLVNEGKIKLTLSEKPNNCTSSFNGTSIAVFRYSMYSLQSYLGTVNSL
jgi:hypothetical protein